MEACRQLRVDRLPLELTETEALELLGLIPSDITHCRLVGEDTLGETYSVAYLEFVTSELAAQTYLRLAKAGFNVGFNATTGRVRIPALEVCVFVTGIPYTHPLGAFSYLVRQRSTHVSSIRYMLDARGTFSGSAFIKYYDEAAARCAARTLNGLRVGSRLIRADLSRRQHIYTDDVRVATTEPAKPIESPRPFKPEGEPGLKRAPTIAGPLQPLEHPLNALYPCPRLRLLRLKSM